MNMIGGGLDGVHEKTHLWWHEHQLLSFIDSMPTCWHVYMLMHMLFQIQIRIVFYIYVSFSMYPIWTSLYNNTKRIKVWWWWWWWCVCACVSESVGERVGGCGVSGCGEWISVCVSEVSGWECVHTCVSGWVGECVGAGCVCRHPPLPDIYPHEYFMN